MLTVRRFVRKENCGWMAAGLEMSDSDDLCRYVEHKTAPDMRLPCPGQWSSCTRKCAGNQCAVRQWTSFPQGRNCVLRAATTGADCFLVAARDAVWSTSPRCEPACLVVHTASSLELLRYVLRSTERRSRASDSIEHKRYWRRDFAVGSGRTFRGRSVDDRFDI